MCSISVFYETQSTHVFPHSAKIYVFNRLAVLFDKSVNEKCVVFVNNKAFFYYISKDDVLTKRKIQLVDETIENSNLAMMAWKQLIAGGLGGLGKYHYHLSLLILLVIFVTTQMTVCETKNNA